MTFKSNQNQIKSNQIKSNQIKSNQIKSNQIKSNQIKSNQSKYISENKDYSYNYIIDTHGKTPDLGYQAM